MRRTRSQSNPRADALEPRRLLSYGLTQRATFPNLADGYSPLPQPGLAVDAAGDVFGVVQKGGANADGSVYELPAGGGPLVTLAAFTPAVALGAFGGPVLDPAGDLFGLAPQTSVAGTGGTLWELPAGGSAVVTVATFPDAEPLQGLARDGAGDFFCVADAADGYDVEEVPAGAATPTRLASLGGGISADQITGDLTLDPAGDLFGALSYTGFVDGGSGSVYELPAGAAAVRTIGIFNYDVGYFPSGPLAVDAAGDVFGTAAGDGPDGDGSLFEIPAGTTAAEADPGPVVLAAPIYTQGAPSGGVVRDAAGDLFFPAELGIFELQAGGSTLVPLVAYTTVDTPPMSGLAADAAGDLFDVLGSNNSDQVEQVVELTPQPEVPAQLAFVGQPADALVGGAVSATVNVEGDDGLRAGADASPVTLSITGGPAGATLGGTTTVAAVGGVATFAGLTVSTPGTYTLAATDASLTAAASAAFSIAGPTTTGLTVSSAAVTDGNPVTLTATTTGPGTVTFGDGQTAVDGSTGKVVAVPLGRAAAAGGVATLTTTLPLGTYAVTAAYGGDATHAPSTSAAVTVVVTRAVLTTIIDSSTVPAQAVAGATLTGAAVAVSVVNPDAAAASPVVVTVSATAADGTAAVIGSTPEYDTATGGSFTVPAAAVPAGLAAGAYTLTVRAETQDGTAVGVATGPTLTVAPAAAVVVPPPGLTAAVVSSPLPAAVVAGTAARGSVVVGVGNAAAAVSVGETTVELYLSTDGAVDAAAVRVGRVVRRLTVRAGAAVRVAVPVSVAATTAAGAYRLVAAVTGPAGAQSSAAAAAGLRVVPRAAAASVAVDGTEPNVLRPGRTAAVVMATVVNRGNVTIDGPATFTTTLRDVAGAAYGPPASATRRLRLRPGQSARVRLPATFSVAAVTASVDAQVGLTYAEGDDTITAGTGPG